MLFWCLCGESVTYTIPTSKLQLGYSLLQCIIVSIMSNTLRKDYMEESGGNMTISKIRSRV